MIVRQSPLPYRVHARVRETSVIRLRAVTGIDSSAFALKCTACLRLDSQAKRKYSDRTPFGIFGTGHFALFHCHVSPVPETPVGASLVARLIAILGVLQFAVPIEFSL